MTKNQVSFYVLLISISMGYSLPRDFYSDRAAILQTEDNSYLGSELVLNPSEQQANSYLMGVKSAELSKAFNDSFYPPSQSFFQTKAQILQSQVFDFIKDMPKGAALHTHDISIASIDWVVANITYRDNLYICDATDPPNFIWSIAPSSSSCSSTWIKVLDKRNQVGAATYDQYLKSLLVINVDNPAESYPHINDVWSTFQLKLGTVTQLVSYEPVFRDYYYRVIFGKAS